MMVGEWDSELMEMIVRPATEDEITQREKDIADAAKPVIPYQVTPMQAKFALAELGLYQNVVDALAALPEPNKTKAKIGWESALDFKRDNALILMIAQALGWTEQQLDELFTLAATIKD